MIKGFKEFITRGNVVELAVAVVMGTAFQKVVDSFVSSIVTPLLNSFGGANSQGWGLRIDDDNPATFVDLSAILNAVIVFLMTAAVIYFLIVAPMNAFNERRRRGLEEDVVEPTEDVALLREIRDLLAVRRDPQL